MLQFPDDTQVSVTGLDDIMVELYLEERKPTDDAAREMITRLEEKGNFIPSSENVHREYAYVLLREYREFIQDRSGS
jgi:predicted nucleic acid-binding protein